MKINYSIKLIIILIFSLFFNCVNAQVDTTASIKNALKIVEKEAEFPGGENALMEFLTTNLKFPKKAIEKEIIGTVQIEFVVCEDGKVCNATIKKTPDALLSNEALRVIKLMPTWIPGEQDKKAVPSYYTLPITFYGGENEVTN